MTSHDVPSTSIGELVAGAPDERGVALLLRHSARPPLPEDGMGLGLSLTEEGVVLAERLGAVMGSRLVGTRSSPVVRCRETAAALARGAGRALEVVPDTTLGEPTVFVQDPAVAWHNWKELGHDAVLERLMGDEPPLPGLADPKEASNLLLDHLIEVADGARGLHTFVTHDLVIIVALSQLFGTPLPRARWPRFLDGALVWREAAGVRIRYRGQEELLVR